MTFYFNILLIELIFVIALDVLHFWDEFSPIISGWITKGKVRKVFLDKPLGCSICMSWWTNLIYSICIGQFSVLNTFIIILLAMFAHEIGGLLFMLKSWIDKIIQKGTITE